MSQSVSPAAILTASAGAVWLTVSDVMKRVQCGRKVVYRAVSNGRLRAATLTGRGDLRFRPEWVDAWVDGLAPTEPQRKSA